MNSFVYKRNAYILLIFAFFLSLIHISIISNLKMPLNKLRPCSSCGQNDDLNFDLIGRTKSN